MMTKKKKKSTRIVFYACLLLAGFTLASNMACHSKKRLDRYALSQDFVKTDEIIKIKSPTSGEFEIRTSGTGCNNVDNYYYDESQAYLFEKKIIRVNFHFINSKDSSQNFNGAKGIKFAKDFLYYSNGKLAENQKMRLPEGNETPVDPIRYRYKLTPDGSVPGDEGVYFHYLDNPFYLNYGKKKNNYDRKIINKYAVNQDSVLNIFYMVHPPDSIKSKKYKVKPAGIALGNSVKLGINFAKPAKPWSYAGLLNHEIGHVLGLSHSWTKNDGCADTPPNPNCWNKGPAPCDGVNSNNVMDYNSLQTAFTPCQLARTTKTLSRINGKKRKLVVKNWCKYNAENDLTIRDTTYWNRLIDLNGNITVEENAQLIISCHLNMAESSKITVKPGGELILANATIYNDCGLSWKGIKLEGTKKNMGSLKYIDTFHLQNLADPIIYHVDN